MEQSSRLEELGKPHARGRIFRFAKLRAVLSADLYRYAGHTGTGAFWRHFLFTPGYKVTVIMRTAGYLSQQPLKGFGLALLFKFLLLRARYKYGIAIPDYMLIGPGLFINRFGGIYFNGDAIIGSNANITHGTMLGQANRGALMGSPILKHRVFMGAGAKIVGRVTLGSDASVGANGVVTKDVPDMGVVGGVPAKLLSTSGSVGYVNRQVPQSLMARCRDAFVGPVPEWFWQDLGNGDEG